MNLPHPFHKEKKIVVRNRTKINGLSLDARVRRGYVLVSPSNHIRGRRYRPLISPDEAAASYRPQTWIIDLVTGKPKQVANQREPIDLFAVLDLEIDPGTRKVEDTRGPLNLSEQISDEARMPKKYGGSPTIGASVAGRRWIEARSIVSSRISPGRRAEKAELLANEERPWPVLDQMALYGLAGEIVKAIKPATEAAPVAILIQFLVFFGNVIGQNAYFVVEATTHYTNLFAVVVGKNVQGTKRHQRGLGP